jgi:thymidylate kinase
MKYRNSTIVLAVLGVDGSGKTTLSKKILKKISNNKIKTKYLHFRPYLFLLDKRTVNKNPYKNDSINLKFFSLIKLIIWFFTYKIFFLKKNLSKFKFIIIDRHIFDIALDTRRYNLNLTKKLISNILNFFPKPNLWLVLDARVNLLLKRKKEIRKTEIIKLKKIYLNFAKKTKNAIVINTNKSIQSSLSLIIKKINSFN